jgi:citrate lyase subunit beta/citryl-CoA lyase
VLCLHPDQVEVANAVFTPSPEDVERARRIVEAFWRSEQDGQASIVVDGVFVDYPIADAASDLLEVSAAIEAMAKGDLSTRPAAASAAPREEAR